ncbi:MAG: hypothetical protein GX440_10455 [Propionibacterium sp.]|nr:hypothetical protein [Propionibacterium sp.]
MSGPGRFTTAINEMGLTTPLSVAAAGFAGAGVPVFPCAPGGKHPITEHGFHEATTNLAQVRRRDRAGRHPSLLRDPAAGRPASPGVHCRRVAPVPPPLNDLQPGTDSAPGRCPHVQTTGEACDAHVPRSNR